MAATTISRIGFGQVEPNHLSAQRTSQIYAQLPAAKATEILENGQFVKYDYKAGEVNTTGKGEWMMVFNEVKLYEHRETYKDFAQMKKNYTNGEMVPRVIKTNIGDIYTTNTIGAGNTDKDANYAGIELEEGDELAPNAQGFLDKDSATAATSCVWQVVKVYTLADGQPAVKLMRIK